MESSVASDNYQHELCMIGIKAKHADFMKIAAGPSLIKTKTRQASKEMK